MLDPGIDALLRLIEQAGYPPMSQGTPETARKAYRAMTVDTVTDDSRVAVGSVSDVVVAGPGGDLPARLYRPDVDGAVPTLVYFHGGGFVIGDLDTHDQTCRRIAAGARVAVLAVDYRLAPEHPFPAAAEDALAAVRWAHEHHADLGGAPVLGVAGDSAGGNLSAVVAQELPDLLDAQILIYPATDMLGEHPSRTENGEGYFLDLDTMLWFGANYLGAQPDNQPDDADPRHSPLRSAPEVLARTPRAWVCTAEYDPLRDEGEAYAAALESAGVEVEVRRYDGLIHGFIDMGLMSPAADAAVGEVVDAVRRLLTVPTATPDTV